MRGETAGETGNWSTLAVLLLGAFLPILDFNVVNLAIPAIRADLHATPAQLQLVINGYMSIYAVLLITGGRLGDRFGRRRMFMLGLSGFTLASALCGTAQTPAWLIAGRLLQAGTATVMAPQVIASIRDIFPGHRLRVALALYGATFGLSFVAGQLVGGLIVQARPFGLSWQPVFLVNVPLGLLALAGARFTLKDTRAANPQRMDLAGVAISGAALLTLVLPLTMGRDLGWPWWCFALLAMTPALVTAFVRWELAVARRGGDPLVRIDLFRRPTMALGAPIAIAFYTTAVMFMLVAILLQDGERMAPAQSGLTIMPLSASYLAVSLVSASLVARLGSAVTAVGMAAQLAGLLVIAAAAFVGSAGISTVGLVLLGAGFGIIMPTIVGTVIGGVEPEHAGLAAGVVMSALQVGASSGVAIVGGVFFAALGPSPGVRDYRHAFALSTSANAALVAIGLALAIALGISTRTLKVFRDRDDRS